MRSVCVAVTVFILAAGFFLLSATFVRANMNSNSFTIQYNNTNMTAGKKTSGTYTVTDTAGQTAVGQYSSAGYLVRSGFQYVYTIGRFTFSISNTIVDLGTVTPGVFQTGNSTLSVSAKGAGGYTVTAHESYPLRVPGTATTIQDTTCNSGTCTESTAAVWTDPSKSGFGYNISGNDVPGAFVDATYFKQFANYSANEPPQIVMSNAATVKNRQATVTYKAAVIGSQAGGTYENHITYIATPGY